MIKVEDLPAPTTDFPNVAAPVARYPKRRINQISASTAVCAAKVTTRTPSLRKC